MMGNWYQQAVEARLPGRAIHLHEKLSSPARKKEPHVIFNHYQVKEFAIKVKIVIRDPGLAGYRISNGLPDTGYPTDYRIL